MLYSWLSRSRSIVWLFRGLWNAQGPAHIVVHRIPVAFLRLMPMEIFHEPVDHLLQEGL